MKRLIERNIASSGLGLALLLLVSVGGASYQSITQLRLAEKRVKQTYVVLEKLDSVISGLKDAEGGRRGYMATGDQTFLTTYKFGVRAIDQEITNLASLTSDNPRQQLRIKALQPLIAKRVTLLQNSIDLRQQNPSNSSRLSVNPQDAELQAQIQTILDEMDAEEQKLLQHQSLESEVSVRNTILVFVVGYTLSFGLLVGVYLLLQERLRERKQAEKALRQSEERWQLIVKGNKDGIWDWNIPDNQTFFSLQFMEILGYEAHELKNSNDEWTTRIHPDDFDRVMAANQDYLDRKIPQYAVEHRLRCKDGTYKWVLSRGQAQWDEAGKPMRMVGSTGDITKRKQAEAALQKLNAELEERVKERTAELEAANQLLQGQKQVLEMLATGASLTDVLDVLTRTIEEQSPQMLCSVLVCDGDGQKLKPGAAPSLPDSYIQAIDGIAIAPNVGSCGTAAYRKEPVIVADIAIDPRWANFRDVALSHGLRACWSQPILSTQDKVLGTFAIYYRQPRLPSLKDLQLIEIAAHIAGIAIEQRQVEQERSRLVAILEASTDYIGMTDPQGNSLWHNAQMKKVLGLDADAEVVKQHISDYHPQWALEVIQKQGLPAAIRDGNWVGETACLPVDGEEIPVSQIIVAHKSPNGSVEYFSTIMHNISNRKQAEAALNKSYNLLQSVLDATPDAIFVKNLKGRFLLMNTPGARLFNKEPWEIIGQDDTVLFSPESVAKIKADEQELIASGNSETFEETLFFQGKWRTLLTSKSVYRDHQGNILGIVGLGRDITPLKQAQDALRQANQELELRVQERTRELILREELLNAFFNAASSANVGLNILDPELRFVRINQALAEINGASIEDHIGKTVDEVLPQIAPTLLPLLQQVLLTGKSISNREVSGEVPSRPGINRDWLVSYFPIDKENTQLKGIGTIVVEITKRKEAERRLKQAIAQLARSNQELEQFAYVASHDLREPLRKIKSYTDLLAKRYQGQLDEKADKYMAYITDGAVRMQALITDLLTYSRVGKGEISLELIDLGAVLNRTLRDISTAIEESNAVITTEPLPTVKANPTQMGQLLQNLIANAIKFHGEQPPQIQIKAALHDQSWTISVQDNGIGIEPQYAERIFVIFQRLHTKEEYSGTGIGLAVCKKIVERHRGRIWFESEPGRGTTFFFTLPAIEEYIGAIS